MSAKGPARQLKYSSVDDVLADIALLRRVGYTQTGSWSLAQIAWHLAFPIEKFSNPPKPGEETPTAEHQQKKAAFVDPTLAAGVFPPGFPAPADFVPPDSATDADIDRLTSLLLKLKAYNQPLIMMGPVGPVPADQVIQMHLIHAALHLGFLVPKGERRKGLGYANEDALIADINRLRRGYAQAGKWSLAQICWHLDITMQARMRPGPFEPNTPEQDARKPIFDQIMATGMLPAQQITAPDSVTPPADANHVAIENALITITKLKNFPGPIVPHRLFGHMPDAVARKQNLIHCAHHLSHLVPTIENPN